MAKAATPMNLKDAFNEPAGEYLDDDTKGLRLKRYPSGKASFIYFYRNPQGVQRKWTLALEPTPATVNQARNAVEGLRGILKRAKKDPELAGSPEADPAAAEIARKVIPEAKGDDVLYPAVARAYMAEYAIGRGTKAGKKPKDNTIIQTANRLGLTQDRTKPKWAWLDIPDSLATKWQKKAFASLGKADVDGHLDSLLHNGSAKRKGSGSPVTANRTYSVLKAFFAWGKRRGRTAKRPEDVCDWDRAIEDKRERFLSEDEIRAFWTATEAMGYPNGDLLRVILLTGCREKEVGEMSVAELDPDLKRWTIPGGRTGRVKNREAHTLPILDDVRAILQAVPMSQNGTYFFSHNHGFRPIKDYAAPKNKCVKLMEGILGKPYNRDPEAPWPERPWVIHDLRHTFSTLNNERDPSASFAVEVVLNHKIKGMKGGYDHAEYKAPKYNLLRDWEADVRRILAGKKAPKDDKANPATSW